MAEIKLTQGQVAIVDSDDYERLKSYKWHARYSVGVNSYYASRNSRIDQDGKSRTIYMHRELMDAKNSDEVDHINHNTLDNRKANLRICTRSQNCSNTRMRPNNRSGFKGVSWCRITNKWKACISVNGKSRYIGLYLTKKDAAVAYDNAAIAHNGDHALTNRKLGLFDFERETW